MLLNEIVSLLKHTFLYLSETIKGTIECHAFTENQIYPNCFYLIQNKSKPSFYFRKKIHLSII